jgi:hypothetical protein
VRSVSLQSVLDELERRITPEAQRHDAFRASYGLFKTTVANWKEFDQVIAAYYTAHYRACMGPGAVFPDYLAIETARDIIDREYRRRGGDADTALHDAQEGTHGGLRVVLDRIAEALKAEAIKACTQSFLADCIPHEGWDVRVELMRQLRVMVKAQLGRDVLPQRPEAYAHACEQVICEYAAILRQQRKILGQF